MYVLHTLTSHFTSHSHRIHDHFDHHRQRWSLFKGKDIRLTLMNYSNLPLIVPPCRIFKRIKEKGRNWFERNASVFFSVWLIFIHVATWKTWDSCCQAPASANTSCYDFDNKKWILIEFLTRKFLFTVWHMLLMKKLDFSNLEVTAFRPEMSSLGLKLWVGLILVVDLTI